MMIYDLFIQITLMSSLGTIVYLVAITMPRVSDTEEVSVSSNNYLRRRLGAIIPLEAVDIKLNAFKDKTLRRLKVFVMRADNFISKRLNNGGDKI